MSEDLETLKQELSKTLQQAAEHREARANLRSEIQAAIADSLPEWFKTFPKSYLESQPKVVKQLSDEQLRRLKQATLELASQAPAFVEREFNDDKAWNSLCSMLSVRKGGALPNPFEQQLRRIGEELRRVMEGAGFWPRLAIPVLPAEVLSMIEAYCAQTAIIGRLAKSARELEHAIRDYGQVDRWDQV